MPPNSKPDGADNPEGRARNQALSIFSGVSAGAGSLGLILGGALTTGASWRWVLFVNVPIGLAVIALAPRFVPELPRRPARLDLPGAVLSTVMKFLNAPG